MADSAEHGHEPVASGTGRRAPRRVRLPRFVVDEPVGLGEVVKGVTRAAGVTEADIAQSMLVTVFNFAVAASGVVGGLLLDTQGAMVFPWALLILALAGAIVVAISRTHGFRPGARGSR
ncbi:hypothetical protein ACIRO1_34490 [Streptomyces sp. NPDC102381]|uniref:hypothetical protein n=1 Tax=Streptomyces sp. NPDC102381 TaxID=3366164 RepID=UPI00381B3E30